MKRREVKGKGQKERYKHLNTEFQRIARRDKKAFFSDQCKEIEENNRMGKTTDLFKKIGDTKGTFDAPEEPRYRLIAGEEGHFPCVVGKEFPTFPSHLKRRPSPQ